jgi:hypothetical protein
MLDWGFLDEPLPRLLEEYARMLETVSRKTLEARRKDYTRGLRTVADYAETHLPPEEDEFVKKTQTALGEEISRIREGIERL